MSKHTFKTDLDTVERTLSVVVKEVIPEAPLGLLLTSGLGIKTEAAKEFLKVVLADTLLMDRKQQDYGPQNIAEFGTYGCVVRMSDKMKRIIHLYKTGRAKRAANESIIDSFRDFSNYGAIALMVEINHWPME